MIITKIVIIVNNINYYASYIALVEKKSAPASFQA